MKPVITQIVLRVCLTTSREDADLVARIEPTKDNAEWCVTKLPDPCKKSDMVVFVDSSAKSSIYVSKSANDCK